MIHFELTVTGERPVYEESRSTYAFTRKPTGEIETYEITKVSGSSITYEAIRDMIATAAETILPRQGCDVGSVPS